MSLRVTARPGGCSGNSYEMYFDTETAADDVEVVFGAVRVVVDPSSAVPVLSCALEPGEHVLACTAWAAPTGAGPEPGQLPPPPVEAVALLERFRDRESEPHEGADIESLIRLPTRETD